MKNLILPVLFMLVSPPVFSQVIKLTNGLSTANVQNNEKTGYNIGYKVGYMGTIGLDYFEKKYFYLSSEVGYKLDYLVMEVPGLTSDVTDETMTGCIHANTTFRVRLPLNKFHVYAGLGPKIDIPVNVSETRRYMEDLSPVVNELNVRDINTTFGAKSEFGINFDTKKFRFGLSASYYWNFGEINDVELYDDPGLKIYNDTFLGSFTVGYKIW